MNFSQQIKEHAIQHIGFDACGFCKAESVDQTNHQQLIKWLSKNYSGGMKYMERNIEKRCDPTLLHPGTLSIICVALNYYPAIKQNESNPQFSYYAYGLDYHDVMKEKLKQLLDFIQQKHPAINGRVFCDTAPLLERYWAAKAGLGFIGKNSLLIIPKKGSYFFLGEILVDICLEYDSPINLSCGRCTICIDKCPTKAIVTPRVIDSNKCISYQTIENKESIIDESIVPYLNNRIYGCDICQQVCPWNRYSRPHNIHEFIPKQAFINLTMEQLERLTIDEYQMIFKGSAVKRAKFEGLKRNINALKETI